VIDIDRLKLTTTLTIPLLTLTIHNSSLS